MMAEKLSSWAAFSHRNFRFFFCARFLGVAAYQMLNVALGQYVFEWTKNPLNLGLIGLSIFIPKLSFSLFGGHLADRYNRKAILVLCRTGIFLSVLAIALLITLNLIQLWMLYALLVVVGIAVAFDGPSSHSLVPQLVPLEHFPNAVTWNTSAFQIAMVAGPVGAGFLYGVFHGPRFVLAVLAGMFLASAALIAFIRCPTRPKNSAAKGDMRFFAGLHYVFKTRLLLGIISLDLFAVLLGGAVALLPVYANDILKVGAEGLGYLRGAAALGAALTSIVLAHLPPMKHAGKRLFQCVAVFGLATIGFGLSRNFYLTLIFLFILGAADLISVIIRGVLVQTKTPQEMRGRVSAVNLVFVGASNELGEFESGLTAAWFGTVPAVVLGGIGTLLVVGYYAWRFPEIRKVNRLDQV